MKKIAIASVATLGIVGAAAVPAFGAASSLTQTQQMARPSVAANVHCKVRHWADREGYRDAIRADAFAGRRGRFGHGHKRDRFHKEVDFDRNEENDVDEVDNDKHHIGAVGAHNAHNEWGLAGHKKHHRPLHDVDVDTRKRHNLRHLHDDAIWKRDAGRIAQRYKERKRWGTEKWCRGKPVAGVHAGGGWHAKSKRK